MIIQLPISKSIANRLLLIAAMRGDDLSAVVPINDSTPFDTKMIAAYLGSYLKLNNFDKSFPQLFNCNNCGTAIRFLTAFFAQIEDSEIYIIGSKRMKERPMGQLVDALNSMGSNVAYYQTDEDYPPLCFIHDINGIDDNVSEQRESFLPLLTISGKKIKKETIVLNHLQSTQFVSALMLIGVDVQTDSTSPYITMTRKLLEVDNPYTMLEYDWSAAAFWYERVAIHGGEVFLEGLTIDSLQGDKVVVDIYKFFNVVTTVEDNGVRIKRLSRVFPKRIGIDFTNCPDLYPAVYATCHCLHIQLDAFGTESLSIKESDRLMAMNQIAHFRKTKQERQQTLCQSFDDHRIAMALLMADYQVDNTDCINKSYPDFLSQWSKL